jgi:hypothetical protein
LFDGDEIAVELLTDVPQLRRHFAGKPIGLRPVAIGHRDHRGSHFLHVGVGKA